MIRIAAFALALLMAVTMLVVVPYGVDWAMAHSSFMRVFLGPRTAILIGEAIAIGMGLWLPIFFGVFAQSKKQEEEPTRLTPLLRRSPETGQREL